LIEKGEIMNIALLHNREAEQSVIGGLILKNKAWEEITDLITEKDFYIFEYQIIFTAMKNLEVRRQPFDWVSLSNELKKMNEFDSIGGDIELCNLQKTIPSLANIRHYATLVKKMSLRRKVVTAAQRAIDIAFNLEEEDFIDKSQKLIGDINENNSDSAKFEDFYPDETLQKIMDDYHDDKNSVYLPTGFSAIDEIIGGFEAKSYVILAARPSMGKTTLAVNIADNIAKIGKSVLVFSLETTTGSLQERRLARDGIVKLERIKTRKLLNQIEISNLATATLQHTQMKVVMDDCAQRNTTVNYIRSQCRRIKNMRGLDFVVIDYIQLIYATEGDNDVSKLTNISRDLRMLAKELDISMLVLSQLNRNVEGRAEKRPMMSDLKQSGALEQDANLIIFIDRPCRNPGNENVDPALANIYIEKNKDGRTGQAELAFLGDYCTFSNYTPGANGQENSRPLKPLQARYKYTT
jgi:replicative DNA helicase